MKLLLMTTFASFTMLAASTYVFSQTQPDVTITYLQNDGVLISDGTDKVLIDAIFNQASGWINLSATEASKLTNAQAPYDDVDLVLITHNHADHYSPSAVTTHLNNNATAKLIAPPPVAANFPASRIVSTSPARGQSDTLIVNGIEVEVLHLRHFDAFGNDFSTVQNFGFLVKISGTNILHLGDVDMTVANFQNFGLAERGIDVVLIPTFNTPAHLTTSHRDALNSQIQPDHIVALHFLSGSIASIRQQVENLYPGAAIFTTPLETFTLNVTSVADQAEMPKGFRLEQNYPNPFNPTTTIEFSLSQAARVSLKIYNVLGKEIRTLGNGDQPQGDHRVFWDGRDERGQPVTSGVYLYKIEVAGFVQVKKMVLVK
jgi:L-ascorbate metabolism protein UlaG (beta-lactamase superfamily)